MLEGATTIEAPRTLVEPHKVKPKIKPLIPPLRPSSHEAADSEIDPTIAQANGVLQSRIDTLTRESGFDPQRLQEIQAMKNGIRKLIAARKFGKEMNGHKDKIEEIQNLQFALAADGEFSPFLKRAELKRLAETQGQAAQGALTAIEPQAQGAQNEFFKVLRDNNVSTDIIDKLAKDPTKALTEDKQTIKALSTLHLHNRFFKDTPTPEEVDALAQTLPAEQQRALDDEKDPKSKWSILMWILMAPLIIVGAIGTAGVAAGGAALKVGAGLGQQ